MMLIGIDPHKSIHTATAIEPGSNREVDSIRIEASLADYRRMLIWTRRWPQRRWAIENDEGLGQHLTSWLSARGEDVIDVPSTATTRVRQLSRDGGRKNDRTTQARQRAWRRSKATPGRWRPKAMPTPGRCWMKRRVNLAQSGSPRSKPRCPKPSVSRSWQVG